MQTDDPTGSGAAARSNTAMVLNLHGVPSDTPPVGNTPCFLFDPQGAWRLSTGDISYGNDNVCAKLHDALAAVIFGSLQEYYGVLHTKPLACEAGLNSESPLTKELFEKFLTLSGGHPYLNQFLYLEDCRNLVSGVQECSKEVVHLLGEFYRALNLDELFYPPVREPDGVRFITSPVTTKITAILGFMFIRLHSLLDYVTKLAHEVEHLKLDFAEYPKLASAKTQFGDYKRLKLTDTAGTLFERCELISQIEAVRDHLIHNGLLDDVPKVYKRIEGGKVKEKYVLFPDMESGHFVKSKNRRLFYGSERKINLELPSMVTSFQQRQRATLVLIEGRLRQRLDLAQPPANRAPE